MLLMLTARKYRNRASKHVILSIGSRVAAWRAVHSIFRFRARLSTVLSLCLSPRSLRVPPERRVNKLPVPFALSRSATVWLPNMVPSYNDCLEGTSTSRRTGYKNIVTSVLIIDRCCPTGSGVTSDLFMDRVLTIWRGEDYAATGQAGPGNDINAGSPGSQKAPT
jgi:hypothetical protein